MRDQLEGVLDDFIRTPALCEASHWPEVKFEFCEAPHTPPKPLQKNQYAVYLFFLRKEWLRVGYTRYPARFTSHHYATKRASSNLSKDIWLNRGEFGFSGREEDVGNWIKENCGRANIRLPAEWPKEVAALLESYLHYRLRPRFEGKRKRKSN